MVASLKLVPPPRPAPRAFAGDDAALVEGFRRGDPAAREALYDRYADHVSRVLCRVLGVDRELQDLHHDVFIRAIRSIDNIEDPAALRAWLTRIAVFVARSAIASRRRRRWLWFLPTEEVPDSPAATPSSDVLDAVRATYAVLETLPVDERVPFALRYVDGMELTEVADACGTSLATVKRRLARAAERFEARARKEPALVPWLEGGARWRETNER